MKRILFIILIVFLSARVFAATATLTISANPGADSFTTPTLFSGRFNVSVSGIWAGAVTLQRSHDTGSTWVDVDNFTSNIESSVDEPQSGGLYYRIGMKNADYVSGQIILRLSK